MLACVRLGFDHPASGQRINITADPGPEFAVLDREFGWTSGGGGGAAVAPADGLSPASP
jgi:hypothetical protein